MNSRQKVVNHENQTVSIPKLVLILWLCINAQAVAQQKKLADTAKTVSAFIPEKQLKTQFARLGKDPEWKALLDSAAARGFVMRKSSLNNKSLAEVWGKSVKGKTEEQGAQEEAEIKIIDLEKTGSKESAALVHITRGAETYKALLIAPYGNMEKVEEFKTEKKEGRYIVVPAHSWWTCLKRELKANCASTCGQSLVSCLPAAAVGGGAFSWATYLGCVAIQCGACFTYYSVTCAF